MTSNLLSIAASGAAAAQAALNITGDNIANANTTGYVRRSIALDEVSTPSYALNADVTLSGVAVSGVTRNADAFLQEEVRRTGANSAASTTALAGYKNVEAAVENTGIYKQMTSLITALQTLQQAPANLAQRTTVLQDATGLASAFNTAATQLASVVSGQQQAAGVTVGNINTAAKSLAAINLQIAAATPGSLAQSSLLDSRDELLQQMSGYADISTTFGANGMVSVTLGGTSGAPLVSGGSAQTLAVTTGSTGALGYTVGGGAVTLAGGTLAGNAQVIASANQVGSQLDAIAAKLASTVNAAQAAGTDLNGSTGTALFSGTTAATLAVTTTDGTKIATAAAGASSGSNDASNLATLNTTLTTAFNGGDPAGAVSNVLTAISAQVAQATTTQGALKTIADAASASLSNEAGVDINTEAVNLTRYQQAFQASGEVMQVAQTTFSMLLSLTHG